MESTCSKHTMCTSLCANTCVYQWYVCADIFMHVCVGVYVCVNRHRYVSGVYVHTCIHMCVLVLVFVYTCANAYV